MRRSSFSSFAAWAASVWRSLVAGSGQCHQLSLRVDAELSEAVLQVALDGVHPQEELAGDLGRADSALCQRANPQFGSRQRVRVGIAAVLPAVCQLELLAGFRRPALGAAILRQFEGASQERSSRTVLARSPQLRAQSIAQARLEEGHAGFGGHGDRLVEKPPSLRGLILAEGGAATQNDHLWKAARQALGRRLEGIENRASVVEAAAVTHGG